MFDGKSVLNVCDCIFEISAPKRNIEKVYKIASVRFQNSEKLYDYLCEDESIKENDIIKVVAKGEDKKVRVVKLLLKKESELSLPIDRYKKIYKNIK